VCTLAVTHPSIILSAGIGGIDHCLQLGMTPSSRSRHLRFGLKCLSQALKGHKKFAFGLQSKALRSLWACMAEKVSGEVVEDVFATTDGLVMNFETPNSPTEEHANFNGYKLKCAKKIVFLFGLDGSILTYVKGPGGLSDSKAWWFIEHKLAKMNIRDASGGIPMRIFRAAGDSAFKASPVLLKEGNIPEHLRKAPIISLFRRIRNCAEISIGSITKSCRIMNFRLPCDDDEMVRLIIECSFLFTNFRIRECGMGQLAGMTHEIREDILVDHVATGGSLEGLW